MECAFHPPFKNPNKRDKNPGKAGRVAKPKRKEGEEDNKRIGKNEYCTKLNNERLPIGCPAKAASEEEILRCDRV
jgi:hypothetical protein